MKSYSFSSLTLSMIMLLSLSMAASQNAKVNWYSFSGGFAVPSAPNTVVKSSAGQMVVGPAHQSNNFLESGFLANPLLRGILVNVGEAKELPLSYSLSQNYPNPFNPTTTIRYEIASEGEVKLEIFNVIGQRVATLANETKTPGRYDVVWDGRNDAGLQLPSGVYFYRVSIHANGRSFVAVMKLMMLK